MAKEDIQEIRQGLINAYQAAGNDYFAYRLQSLFKEIVTEEDRILHNEIFYEVEALIEPDEHGFFRRLAGIILRNKTNMKTLLVRVAEAIMRTSHK